jgi:hypothetical protein
MSHCDAEALLHGPETCPNHSRCGPVAMNAADAKQNTIDALLARSVTR